MAANSIRERIILSDIEKVGNVAAISTVVRTMQTYSELQNFAGTQFPVAAVVGRIPVPQYKTSGRIPALVDQCISELKVDIFVYFINNENADEQLSSMLDDIFVALFQDQSRSNLCLSTELRMDENNEVWAPFAAFKITCVHKYKHDTGGI